MKVEELMLGDWVMIAECNPKQVAIGCAKIVGIDRKISIEPYTIGFEYSFYDDEGEKCIALNSCSIDRLRPIPLTAEILEKNEFKQIGKKFIMGEIDDELIEITPSINNSYRIKVSVADLMINCSVWCSYVHELQHALRLCGIDKEIIL